MQTMSNMRGSFQSTLSVRRATTILEKLGQAQYISIHALRKESDIFIPRILVIDMISIHALRKESDLARQ